MNNFFEQIDAYVSGTLPDDEVALFENELLVNESLKHAVDNYGLLKEVSASLIEDETRSQLTAIKNKTTQPDSHKKRFQIKTFMVAAAAAFILVLISNLVFRSNLFESREDKIVALAESPPPSEVLSDRPEQNLLSHAEKAFEDKKYKEAIQLFSKDFHSDSLQAIASKYLGYLYLQEKKYDKAIQAYEVLQDHPSLNQSAHYHLTLCYLLKNDTPKARRHYDLIKNKLPEEKKNFIEKELKN